MKHIFINLNVRISILNVKLEPQCTEILDFSINYLEYDILSNLLISYIYEQVFVLYNWKTDFFPCFIFLFIFWWIYIFLLAQAGFHFKIILIY